MMNLLKRFKYSCVEALKAWRRWCQPGFTEIYYRGKPLEPDSKGRVVTHTKAPTYRPDIPRQGGRVVKAMPKQLKQMKEAQEKVSDDEVSQLP